MSSALGNPIRWAVLQVLFTHEALPTTAIAKFVGEERSRLSKHLRLMTKLGVIEHWHGKIYRIPPRFRVPGEAVVDFGCVVIRMNRSK